MMRMQWVASNFCPYLFWGFCFQTRVSRVLRASNSKRVRRWIYPTALILLRRRFLVQIRPIF